MYKTDDMPGWMIRVGLILYDLLAGKKQPPSPTNGSPPRKPSRALPASKPGLTVAASYWDAQVNDARLVLENVLGAREAGAIAGVARKSTDAQRRRTVGP
jgi:glycerol-3-phosphate dehydrogenase